MALLEGSAGAPIAPGPLAASAATNGSAGRNRGGPPGLRARARARAMQSCFNVGSAAYVSHTKNAFSHYGMMCACKWKGFFHHGEPLATSRKAPIKSLIQLRKFFSLV